MFKLEPDATWTWPVVVRVPSEGGFLEKQFRAHFRLIEEERRRELDAMPQPEGTDQLLREAVVKVLDVTDQADELQPHSAELFQAMIKIPWIRIGLLNSYLRALSGAPPEAASGN